MNWTQKGWEASLPTSVKRSLCPMAARGKIGQVGRGRDKGGGGRDRKGKGGEREIAEGKEGETEKGEVGRDQPGDGQRIRVPEQHLCWASVKIPK